MSIGSAIIGALRVNLGLDSAEFTAGLKVAKGELGAFGKFAKTSLVALAGVAVGLASAFGVAAKGAIDHADALSKMSQKAGVSTESLSRLAYAASFSEVSLEDTTAALGKLSKTMADAAQNTKGIRLCGARHQRHRCERSSPRRRRCLYRYCRPFCAHP
jgi:hypothetical protein